MARINWDTIRLLSKERYNLHEVADATYSIYDIDGTRFLQLDSYGRSYRENPGKISQSFQFDRESARQLINLLRLAFADIDESDNAGV